MTLATPRSPFHAQHVEDRLVHQSWDRFFAQYVSIENQNPRWMRVCPRLEGADAAK